MIKRAFPICVLSLFASLLAACGGGGSAGSIVPSAMSNPETPTQSVSTQSVPAHVQTGEYLWSTAEEATSPSTYAPYLSWAYTKASRAALTRAAGIKVVIYMNPLMPHGSVYEMTQLNGNYANVRARDCSGNLVKSWSGSGYLADVRSSSAAAYVKNVADNYVNALIAANGGARAYDAIYMDDANSFYGLSAMPCSYSDSDWTSAMDSTITAEGYPTIINTLSTNEAGVASKVAGLKASNIVGGEYEHCFDNRHWLSEEMSQLQAIALLKSQGKAPGPGFWCYVDGTTVSGSTVIPTRLYEYASFLLTYDVNYSVFQESYSTPSTFHVFPETGFVALDPLTQPSQISDLQTASGAYVREYRSCYYRGSAIGACEIAVNPQTAAVAIPNSYSHSAVIDGAGVLDGGTVTFDGPAVTTLQPQTAAILVGSGVTSAATSAPVASSSSSASVSGVITWVSTSATKFEVKQSDGSRVYVYLSAPLSNALAGEYLTASGTGTDPVYASTSSVSVSPSASPAPGVSGKILWVSTSATKLRLLEDNGTAIYVYYTKSTQLNYSGRPSIGQYARVTGAQASPMYATAVWLSDSPL